MPHARLDDRYDDHKKIKRALRREPAAIGFHAMAITYCNRHVSDGLIEVERVEEWLALTPYKPAQRQRLLDTLLELELFERRDEETFIVHDFLEWNLSRAQRAQLAEQGRKGGRARGVGSGPPNEGGSSPGPGNGSSEGLSEGSSDVGNAGSSTPFAYATPTPTPTPRRPPSLRSDGVAAAPPRNQTDQAVEDLCQLMSDHVRAAHGIDPSSREARVTKGWRNACRATLTLDGYTQEQIAFAIRWVCRHHYWRRRIKSMTRLRSEMGQVVKDIREQRERGAQVVPLRRENASDWLRDAGFVNGEPVVANVEIVDGGEAS